MDFLSSNSIWIYFFIFFGKILEVTISTIRMVMINRGERTIGSLIAFVEIILWIFITGSVLVGFQEAPLKIVVFALAFAIGNYVGSWLEGKIALGLCTIQVITNECPDLLLALLRSQGLAVTVLEGEGKEGPRHILAIHLKRKRISSTVRLINKNMENCFITVSDVRVLKGGYIKK
ncbi:MAG: DUF5698 domain-containing protein [Clostridia bacterium]